MVLPSQRSRCRERTGAMSPGRTPSSAQPNLRTGHKGRRNVAPRASPAEHQQLLGPGRTGHPQLLAARRNRDGHAPPRGSSRRALPPAAPCCSLPVRERSSPRSRAGHMLQLGAGAAAHIPNAARQRVSGRRPVEVQTASTAPPHGPPPQPAGLGR